MTTKYINPTKRTKMPRYIILRDGMVKDFTVIECATLEDAKAEARRDYDNYGHNTATVAKYVPVYTITKGDIEITDMTTRQRDNLNAVLLVVLGIVIGFWIGLALPTVLGFCIAAAL